MFYHSNQGVIVRNIDISWQDNEGNRFWNFEEQTQWKEEVLVRKVKPLDFTIIRIIVRFYDNTSIVTWGLLIT